MKVKTLLNLAAACTTEDGAQTILEALQAAFAATKALGHLPTANSEAFLEGPDGEAQTVCAHFELNYVLSPQFILMIRPEIRDNALTVDVVMNRMRDGLGMQSRDWEVFLDLEDLITADTSTTVAHVAKQAKDLALAQHAKLLESVGVTAPAAARAARQSW